MRHERALDYLINPRLTLRWPAAAALALGSLAAPQPSSREPAGLASAKGFVETELICEWEWLTDTRLISVGEDQTEEIETREDLILDAFESDWLARQYHFAVELCRDFGVPADITLELPNGETLRAQTRPLPPGSGLGPLGESRERDERAPSVALAEALRLTRSAASLSDLAGRFERLLLEQAFSEPPEAALPAFQALWPGDSFEQTARARRLLGSCDEAEQKARLAKALPRLDAQDARGRSPLRALLEISRPHSSLERWLTGAASLHLFLQTGPSQQRALDDLAAFWLARAGDQPPALGSEAAAALALASSDQDRALDFGGPLGELISKARLKTPLLDASPAEAAELEAALLGAQSALASRLAQPKPAAPRRAHRV